MTATVPPLHWAATAGSEDVARVLITATGIMLDATESDYGGTPLHWTGSGSAAENNSPEVNAAIAQALIDAGANVNARAIADNNTVPLHWAANNGGFAVAEVLIDAGANVDAERGDGVVPLGNAGWRGRDDIVQLLVDNSADVNGGSHVTEPLSEVIFGRRAYDLDPEMRAAVGTRNRHLQAMSIMIDAGANVNAPSETFTGSTNSLRPLPTGSEYTALHLAAYYCDVARVNDIAQLLLDNNANLGAQTAAGETPLQIAQSRTTQTSECRQLIALLESDCPISGERGYDTGTAEPVCAPALPAAEYSTADCETAGWTVSFAADENNNIAAHCGIPITVQATAPESPPEETATASRSDAVSPLQVAAGDSYDSCVLAAHSGFDTTALAACDDADLFADNNLPQKPAGFDSAPAAQQRLIVVPPPAPADGQAQTEISRVYFQAESGGEVVEISRAARAPVSGGGSSGGGGGGSSSSAGLIIGGVVVVGGLMWLLSDGGETGEFSFSPDFGYSATESGYSAKAGGRMDFRKDEWHLYYAVGQTNRDGEFGDFRYESGGEYRTDLWRASFSESVQGDNADYDFALSANWQNGIWRLSPTYRFHSTLDLESAESESRNSLNLQAAMQLNRWTIRPTAGFNWRRMDEFGDKANFRLQAVRRF